MSAKVTHGHAGRINGKVVVTPTYSSWCAMRKRCLNPNHRANKRYHALWHEPWRSFEVFLADMGLRPDGTTLDRINSALPYGPGNTRWATPAEQSRNRPTSKLTYEIAQAIRASTETNAVLARRYGVNHATIHNIINNKIWRTVK